MHSYTVNNPLYPAKTSFFVADFPWPVENGKTVEVADEDVKEYNERTGRDFKEVVEGINGAEYKHTTAKSKKDGE